VEERSVNEFSADDNVFVMLACWPVGVGQRAAIEQLNSTVFVPKSLPTDTITKCEACQMEIWIGAQQKKLHDKKKAVALCMMCAGRYNHMRQRQGARETEFYSLKADES
jgi:hypothetical protein